MTNDIIAAAICLAFWLGYLLANWLYEKLQERKDILIAAQKTFIESLQARLASREFDQGEDVA